MGKFGAALTGVLIGGAVALVYAYLFGPAPETSYDDHYRSRLDDALQQGQRAAEETEIELRGRYQQLRTNALAKPPSLTDDSAAA